MPNSYIKKLLYAVLLLLSPLASLVLLGLIYIVIRMISGMELLAAVAAFKVLIYGLIPYFPYLTTIPAVLVLLGILSKNWRKIKKLAK